MHANTHPLKRMIYKYVIVLIYKIEHPAIDLCID